MASLQTRIFYAIIFACCIYLLVILRHSSHFEETQRDSKSISHPLQEQYNVLSQSVAEKRQQLRNMYLEALRNQSSREDNPYRDGADSRVDVESPRNFLLPEKRSSTYHSIGGFDLPGAVKDHKILTLSDEAFESTPVSEMMSWYGEALGKDQCPSDFGNALVRRWRKNRKKYCHTTGKILLPKSGVTIDPYVDCFPTKQYKHGGLNDNLCIMSDVSMNVGIFGDKTLSDSVIKTYVSSGHMDMPYIHYPKGFLKSTCAADPNHWNAKYLPGWNADLTVKSMELIPSNKSPENIEKEYACSEWVDHEVLFVQRDTFANFFHDSEDFVNVFLALAILEWQRGDMQVIITDLFPGGPFWDIWTKVYSPQHGEMSKILNQKVITAWDLSQKYGLNERICFRKAAVGIFGPAAPIAVASWNTFCSRTALVRAYADFVIRGLNLHTESHYAKQFPEDTVTITYMARREYSEWPEKKFCNDTHSFFKCKHWENFGKRRIGRMIRNDNAIVDAFKKFTHHEKKDGSIVKVIFNDADFNKHKTFRDQIAMDLKTDILVGAHGAGLMHSIFLRERGALIELSIDGSGTQRHFHNLAHWAGKAYYNPSCPNPVDVNALMTVVRKAIDDMDMTSY